jgi:hypothetical protein
MTYCIFLKQSFITFIHKVSSLARGLFVRFSHVTHSKAVVIPIIVVSLQQEWQTTWSGSVDSALDDGRGVGGECGAPRSIGSVHVAGADTVSDVNDANAAGKDGSGDAGGQDGDEELVGISKSSGEV